MSPINPDRVRAMAVKFCPPAAPKPPEPKAPRTFASCKGTSRRILAWLTSHGAANYRSVARALGILPHTANTVM